MSGDRKLTISAQSIDVWLAFYHELVDQHLLSDLRALLNDAECLQEQRFHFADDRKRYLVTRAMVRTVLSRYAAVGPADWAFSTNAYGRPDRRRCESRLGCASIRTSARSRWLSLRRGCWGSMWRIF
jgi:4'-phosphopantetheinyl transferase